MSKVLVDSFKKSNSALEIFLHPLVIINISDHFTRSRLANKPLSNIIGILFGTQKGRKVELRTSFELITTLDRKTGEISIDETFFNKRFGQFQQVFHSYEILGWYHVGEEVTPPDFQIHKHISHLSNNDNPIFLLCGGSFSKVTELPIHLFEAVVSGINEKTNEEDIVLNYLDYKIETEISEQISLDYIGRNISSVGGNNSGVTGNFNKMKNAVQMLQSRVKVIIEYLGAVKNNKCPVDHDLLRRCADLSERLPAMDSKKFDEDYLNEINEVMMISYLSSMTKATDAFNDYIDKFNVNYEKRRGNRTGSGLSQPMGYGQQRSFMNNFI